jgi:hypothetical protein
MHDPGTGRRKEPVRLEDALDRPERLRWPRSRDPSSAVAVWIRRAAGRSVFAAGVCAARASWGRAASGTSRMAIALAATVDKKETVAGLTDEELFQRLFRQRHAHVSRSEQFDGREIGIIDGLPK